MLVPVDVWTLILKKWFKEMLFLWNQSVNVIYSNKENVFMVHNHEKKGDYYMRPCLSQLKDELWFQKTGGKDSFLYEAKVSTSSILIRRMCLLCPIVKRENIIMNIHVCPNRWMYFNSKKMVKRKTFPTKPKHQCHLFQQGEYVYGT